MSGCVYKSVNHETRLQVIQLYIYAIMLDYSNLKINNLYKIISSHQKFLSNTNNLHIII